VGTLAELAAVQAVRDESNGELPATIVIGDVVVAALGGLLRQASARPSLGDGDRRWSGIAARGGAHVGTR